jgi:putative phosphoesterase
MRASIDWLSELPTTREYCWSDQRVLLAHGSPHVIDEYVFPDQIPKRFKRAIRTVECDLLLLGHTHTPMAVRLGRLWVVNPGSVAGARTRDSHTCAVVDLPAYRFGFYSLHDGAEVEVATG